MIMLIGRADLLGLIDNVPSNFGTRFTSIYPKGGYGGLILMKNPFRSIKYAIYYS